jgi:hypothetical protein
LTGGQTEKVNKGKPLEEKDILDLKKKRDSNIAMAFMIDGYIKKFNHLYIRQID